MSHNAEVLILEQSHALWKLISRLIDSEPEYPSIRASRAQIPQDTRQKETECTGASLLLSYITVN
jgi:hypothetical protein